MLIFYVRLLRRCPIHYANGKKTALQSEDVFSMRSFSDVQEMLEGPLTHMCVQEFLSSLPGKIVFYY